MIPTHWFALCPLYKLTRKRGRARLSPLQLWLHSVTLTHFSKMQPPVEPSGLTANRSYSRRKAVKGRVEGRREGERIREAQTLAACYRCHILKNMMWNRWRRGEGPSYVIFSSYARTDQTNWPKMKKEKPLILLITSVICRNVFFVATADKIQGLLQLYNSVGRINTTKRNSSLKQTVYSDSSWYLCSSANLTECNLTEAKQNYILTFP